MNIYKIDSLHRHVLIDNGGCIKSNSPTQHEFDLPNHHTYNEKGELIGERDLGKMDLDFCNKLASIKPVERVEDFLDYQLENSEDKLTFFKHIKTGVIVNSYKISNSPARQQVLIDWIKEKKNKLEETPKEETFEPLEFDNLSQKLLLLESLGVLKAISETTGEQISSRKMGRIIAEILETNDLTRHLRYFNPHSQPKDKNNPRTIKNLQNLHSNLIRLKLPLIAKNVEEELGKLYSK